MGYRRKFAGEDHVLTVNLSREQTQERNDNPYTIVSVAPASPNLFREARGDNDLTLTQIKVDYNRPMAHEGRLKVGYDLRIDDNHYARLARLDPARLPPARTSARPTSFSTNRRSTVPTPPTSSRSATGRCWAACGSRT